MNSMTSPGMVTARTVAIRANRDSEESRDTLFSNWPSMMPPETNFVWNLSRMHQSAKPAFDSSRDQNAEYCRFVLFPGLHPEADGRRTRFCAEAASLGTGT